MAAGSARAMAPNTTRRAACASARPRRILPSRLTPSPPIPRSRSDRRIMAHPSSYQPGSGVERWLDARLPLPRLMHDQFLVFPTPRNLNYWWTFGGILTFMLAVQILTGVVLAMHYIPAED